MHLHAFLNISLWVIPNHFNKSLQVTLSEMDKIWYVTSDCGFMKPNKIPYVCVLYGFLVKANYKFIILPMFTRLSIVQFLVTFPLFILFKMKCTILQHKKWAFIWHIVWLYLMKLFLRVPSYTLTLITQKVLFQIF